MLRMSRTRMTLLTVALLAMAHPLFAVVIVAGPLAVVAFHAWEFLVPPVAWTVFAVAGSILDRPPLPGVPVRPAEEPELARLVSEIAERLEIRRPLAVRVVPSVDAGVYDQKLRGRPASVIVLGWPLVKHLSAAELRAVVAHELAHREHLDDKHLGRMLTARAQLADRPPRQGWPPRRWRTALLRATQQASYDQELASDAAAAQVAGAQDVVSALRNVDRLDTAYEMLASTWVDVLAEQEQWPEDLYAAMDDAWLDPWVSHRIDRMLAERPPHDDEASHPATQDRIEALGAAPAEPGEPLRLRNPKELEAHVAELFSEPEESAVRILDLEPDALHDETSGQELIDEIVEVTGADGAGDALAKVHALVRDGQWVAFAEQLEPGLRHAPPEVRPGAERMVMGGAFSRLLVTQLRNAGWQRASRWVRSPLVRPDGTTVDVRDVIDAALASGPCSELDALVQEARS